VLPAIASPDVAERLGRGPRVIETAAGYRTVRVAGVRQRTPAVPDDGYLLVDSAGLNQPAATTPHIDRMLSRAARPWEPLAGRPSRDRDRRAEASEGAVSEGAVS
jgi:hypothetical protein